MIAFLCGKMKTVFQFFTPAWEHFKICLTYFKISQTYFLPPENPPGWCRRPMALRAHIRLPARPENADKTQIRTGTTGTHVKQTRESAGFVPLS